MIEICLEASGAAGQSLQQSCAQAAAQSSGVTVTFAEAPCSRVNALGACRITAGGIVEDAWYYNNGVDAGYAGQTSADIQMLCAQEGATFLPP
jgi:hypothetical protein